MELRNWQKVNVFLLSFPSKKLIQENKLNYSNIFCYSHTVNIVVFIATLCTSFIATYLEQKRKMEC